MAYHTDGGEEEGGRDGRPRDMYTVNNENPRDRDPGMLTYDDREYLLGEKDVSGGSETQLRQRMRDRVRNGLLDFELLMMAMESRDIQTIFDNTTEPPWPDGLDGGDLYHGSVYALAFIYYGITECTFVNFERLLEDAIERASGRKEKAREGPHGQVADASVNIEVEWSVGGIDHNRVREKLRNGDRLTNQEIGSLIRHGELEEEDWKQLREGDFGGSLVVDEGGGEGDES